MLKIKSNTNEFTIIFSEKIGKKKNAQKISFSLCSVQHPFFFSPSFLRVSVSFPFFCFYFQCPSLFLFSASPFCFFSFSWSAAPFSSSLFFLLFLFFWSVALYFSAQNTFFSAQTFFSPKTLFSAQNVFASAQNFFQFSPKLFFFCFSSATLLFFFFLLYSFLVQPSLFSFSASFFSFL